MQDAAFLDISGKRWICHEDIKVELLVFPFLGSQFLQTPKTLTVGLNPFLVFFGFVTPAVKIQCVQV